MSGGRALNNHIRFDEGDDNVASTAIETDAANKKQSPPKNNSDVKHASTPTRLSTDSGDHRRNGSKRRKRKRTAQKRDDEDITPRNNKIFHGLVVSISTLESKKIEVVAAEATASSTTIIDGKGDDEEDLEMYQNYKSLKHKLHVHGATISPQVHRRVHYLISTEGAVQHLTQRVRQALKRSVDVVDVAWVKRCVDEGRRVEVTDEHSFNELARFLVAEKEREKANERGGDGVNATTNEGASDIGGVGWSDPLDLECCCVCHENGDDNCPWCADCNLTLARKKAKKI